MFNSIIKIIAAASLALLVSGCATQANRDPLESLNRGVYKFNDAADKAVLKPVAGAYKAVVPQPVRNGVNNFFSNLDTFTSVINDLLQLKISKAMDGAGRFVINTTFGIVGLIDVASMDGIEQRREDFGQTLGYWGVGSGPYLVLPLLGPSTLRDTTGLVVDTMAFDPLSYIDDTRTSNQLRIVKIIDTRAQFLPASDLLDEAALDPYSFMRDAYLQRRENAIADGSASANADDDYDAGFYNYEEDDASAAPADK